MADDKLADETMQLAEQIAAMPVTSLVGTKKILLDARVPGIERARRKENEIIGGLQGGPANREAIAAFLEKRAPDFSKIRLSSRFAARLPTCPFIESHDDSILWRPWRVPAPR